MHEQDKIREARYFLDCLREQVTEHDPNFRYSLSAFLSAGRSVLQYFHRKAKSGNRVKWYEKKVSCNTVLKFFKDQRDINIHEHPVDISAGVTFNDTVSVSDSLTIVVRRGDGSEETFEIGEDSSNPEEGEQETRVEYRFSDWRGSGDGEIVGLSKDYLRGIEGLYCAARKDGIV